MTSQSRNVTPRMVPSLVAAAALLLAMTSPAAAQVKVTAVKPAPIRATPVSKPLQQRLTITSTRPRTTNEQSRAYESEVRASQMEAQQQRRPSLASLARTSAAAPSKPKPVVAKVAAPVSVGGPR